MGFMDQMKDAASQAMSEAKSSMGSMRTAAAAEREDREDLPSEYEKTLYEVVSHIKGKNAKVRLYPDRIEWERARGVSAAKLTAATFTAGASLLVTGVKGGKDAYDMVLLRNITNVSNRKDGLLYHLVEVQTAQGGAINSVPFRVTREEAGEFRDAILKAMKALQEKSDAPIVIQQSAPAAPAAPAADGAAEQIRKLAELHAQGILSDEEFAAAKAKALGL